MSDFQGMEDMLQDFLTEAGELLSGVDNKLVELEGRPGDAGLLNDIFRGQWRRPLEPDGTLFAKSIGTFKPLAPKNN